MSVKDKNPTKIDSSELIFPDYGQNFMLAHTSIYGSDIPIYGYIWIRQYGKMLYMWASMKFLPCIGLITTTASS